MVALIPDEKIGCCIKGFKLVKTHKTISGISAATYRLVEPIVGMTCHHLLLYTLWKQFFFNYHSETALTPNNLERQVLRERWVWFSSGQMIQTRYGWVGSANTSSVLCRPPPIVETK